MAERPEAETYQFDKAQNILAQAQVEEGILQPVDSPVDPSGRNRPSRINGIDLTWNDNGNLTAKGDMQLRYDWRNRLRRVLDSGGATVAEYRYDIFNRRVERQVGDDTFTTVWDAWRSIEEYNGTNLKSRLTYGLGLDEAIEIERDLDGNGTLEQRQVPIYDNTGNLTVITDGDGEPLERYEYTAFGRKTILSGQLRPIVEQIRQVGGELWLETNVEVLFDQVETAIENGDIRLERTADATSLPLTAHHPVQHGRQARRRLVITTTDPPANGDEVQLTIEPTALRDTFHKEAESQIAETFLWQDGQVVVDTRAPTVEQVIVRDGRLEVEWSEPVDLAAATAAITIDGVTDTWTVHENGYRLLGTSAVGAGNHDLGIATSAADLAGTPLAEVFELAVEVTEDTDSFAYRAKHRRELDESAVGNEYGFHGRPVDQESGLIYVRNRYYDPELP